MSYVMVAAAIGTLILLHEAGHLVSAKAGGLPLQRFSVGFGPRVWGTRRGDIEYRLSAIPCGGYVLPGVQTDEEWLAIPLRTRVAFSLGGPLANVVTAYLCLAVASMVESGISVSAGILTPFAQLHHLVLHVWSMIPRLFTSPSQLSGVVGVTVAGGREIGLNAIALLRFSGLLSINLAVLNLMPFPPLDGGTILMSILQRIHRPLGHLRLPLALAGWCVLGFLILYTTALDVWRLVRSGIPPQFG